MHELILFRNSHHLIYVIFIPAVNTDFQIAQLDRFIRLETEY